MLFALGTLVLLPWLLRSFLITGQIPGLAILFSRLSGGTTATTLDLPTFGTGHSPFDLVRLPWDLTFSGGLFNQSGDGDVGVLLLIALPLTLLAPRTRALSFLGVATGVSYLGWALTAQYTRYLLPTLALAAALSGIGVASAIETRIAVRPTVCIRAALPVIVPVAVLAGLVAAPLLFLQSLKANWGAIDVIDGSTSAAEFVAARVPAMPMFATASAMLPPDTPVGYFGLQMEGAQAYTEARLIYVSLDPQSATPGGDLSGLGATDEAGLAGVRQLGVDYFIWSREETIPSNWRSWLLSTQFLRDHTQILAGDHGSYLFALRSDGGSWRTDRDANLLLDPGLSSIKYGGPWSTEGRVRPRQGTVPLRSKGTVLQQVAATAGTPYLLLTNVKCADPSQRARLSLRWLDERGRTLDANMETVVPGTNRSEQFVWHVAPERTTSVVVALSVASADASCEFDGAFLYASS
jgi:hypothetical protein